jgi:hypothetical protein
MKSVKLTGLLLVIAFPTLLVGQTEGSISGVITDPVGATIGGATVTATNQDTNAVRTATTNSSGLYSLASLVPGVYTLKIENQGFAPVEIRRTLLTVAQSRTVNVTLNLSSVRETVEVNGEATAPVETESTQLSTLISNKTITDLPLLTRNPYELVLLSPGTNQSVDGTGGFSVNGSRDRNNNFLLDGVDNNDTSVPGIPIGVIAANPDSTQEFRVITDTFNPEYGRNTGAIIDVITRSGTNNFHGDAYEFGRYNALGARDFFNSRPEPQNPYVRNQFGFSVGGPIIRNRTFFFINGEFQRFRTTLTANSVVPTAAFKSGLFTLTQTGQQIDVRTPSSPGNQTGLGVDPEIAKVFALLPNPNAGDVIPGVSGNLKFASPDNLNGYEWTGKIDHKITEKHQLHLRYAYNHSVDSDPFHTEFAPGLDVLGSPSYSHGVFAGLTSVLSNRVVNDFKFGWNKVFAGFASNCAGVFDPITGTDPAGFGRDFAVPDSALGVSPLFTLGCNTLFDASGQLRHTGTTSYADSITWVRGNHTVKFGGDFRDVNSSGFDNFLSRDTLSFGRFAPPFSQSAVTLNPNTDPNQVQPIQDLIWMLLGGVTTQFQAQFFNKSASRVSSDDKKFIQHEYDGFMQDTWKIRKNLTLNYGVRYQFDGVPFESNGNFSNLFHNADSFGKSYTFSLVGPGDSRRNMYNNDFGNVEPRFGIAWDPRGNGKMSIRAAYGIFHDRIFDNLFGNARGNPPFQSSVSNLFANSVPIPETTPFAQSQAPSPTITSGQFQPVTLLDTNIRMPASQNWNFGIQQEITNGLVVEIDYVGSHSTHVIRALDAVPPDPALVQRAIHDCVAQGSCAPGDPNGLISGSALYTGLFDPNTGAQIAPPSIRETALQVQGGLPSSITKTNADSRYNSLQAKITKTLSHGLEVGGAYTWAHATDDSNDPLNTELSGFGTFPIDSRNANTVMRGNSDNDLRQRATVNFLYEFPFGKGRAYLNQGVAGKTLEGIQLSGIISAQTGHPYTILIPGIDTARTGDGAGPASWPNVVGNPYANSGPRIQPGGVTTGATGGGVLNQSNVFPQAPFGSEGNAGRNQFYGPHYTNADVVIMKNFQFTERFRLQLRSEFFNVLNHPQFQQPGNLVGQSTLGLSTLTITRSDATTSARQIQLALKLFF